MKKELRVVEQEKGIVRITTVDERWYAKSVADPVTGLPTYAFVPSVTWIAEHYPKGLGFYKWLAQTGWDEAQALKEAAGDKGSKVHAAIAAAFLKGVVEWETDSFLNPSTGQLELLTTEEYACLMSFHAWFQQSHPTLESGDLTVWNDTHGYAGTIDAIVVIDGVRWLIDFKTSQQVYPSHEMQVSAYNHCLERPAEKLGILQLGYRRNRDGYKLTEVDDCFDLFLHTKAIWQRETRGQQPLQRDYPLRLAFGPQPQEAGCAPSEADGRTTNGSPLTSGSPARSRKSSTTSAASTT